MDLIMRLTGKKVKSFCLQRAIGGCEMAENVWDNSSPEQFYRKGIPNRWKRVLPLQRSCVENDMGWADDVSSKRVVPRRLDLELRLFCIMVAWCKGGFFVLRWFWFSMNSERKQNMNGYQKYTKQFFPAENVSADWMKKNISWKSADLVQRWPQRWQPGAHRTDEPWRKIRIFQTSCEDWI